jgi:hypothetical protein
MANCRARLRSITLLLFWITLAVAHRVGAQTYPPPPIVKDGTAILIQDYANLPLSGRGGSITSFGANVNTNDQLGRVNFLRSEPTNAALSSVRFFVNDLNRNLYILNRSNRTFSTYINFQAVFPKFNDDPGYAGGLVTFAFDPEYATNGIFYTVHTEIPVGTGSANPSNTNLPGLNTNGYSTTPVINPPEYNVAPPRQAVLVEWTDTNINNATFEGSAREILRIGFNSNIHPLGDLIFNPLAHPGDADYRNLYIAVGDGGAGEEAPTNAQHYLPQRLDSLQGKVLRITPDLNLRTGTSITSANGRYRVPASGLDPNPFVNTNGARPEIFTYGHRNPHRLSWDPVSGQLFEFEIGLTSFEEVNIIHKGENYGYSEREGTKQLNATGTGYNTAPPGYELSNIPNPDLLPIRITNNPTATMVPVHYPVAEFFQTEGDAMSSGFVYRGGLMPELNGKLIFGDITTGRIFYCNIDDLIAADDINPATIATIHEIQIVFNSPTNPPTQAPIRRRMFDIVADQFLRKGGHPPAGTRLPGFAQVTAGLDPSGVPYGTGRSDIRLATDSSGELYILSKSDGMIRQVAALVGPPVIQSASETNNTVTFTWKSISGQSYRAQHAANLSAPNWIDLPGDVLATGTNASKSDTLTNDLRFYRIKVLP